MRLFIALSLLFFTTAAEAYIGPGAGLSLFGSLWAVLVGIVLSVGAVLLWPVKWAWRRLRRRLKDPSAASASDA